jgi:hypothetical protein
MHRLVAATRSEGYREAHPVVQAAYLHHGLTSIHPFPDGNGRVARVLASVPLLRAVSLPLVLYADEKPGYLDALAAADRGATGELITWFENRVLDTMEDVVDALQPDAELDDAAARLDRSLGAADSSLALNGLRLLDELERAVVELLNRAAPDGIQVSTIRGSASAEPTRRPVVRERGALICRVGAAGSGLEWGAEHHCVLRWADETMSEAVLEVEVGFPVEVPLPLPPPLRLRRGALRGASISASVTGCERGRSERRRRCWPGSRSW